MHLCLPSYYHTYLSQLTMQAEKVFGDVQPRAHGEGTYVRATGLLKAAPKDSTNGSTFLMAFSVKPITSFNEVSRHALEVMRSHLKLKQARLTKENVISDAVPYVIPFPMLLCKIIIISCNITLIAPVNILHYERGSRRLLFHSLLFCTFVYILLFAFVFDRAAVGSSSCLVATIRLVVLRRFRTASCISCGSCLKAIRMDSP